MAQGFAFKPGQHFVWRTERPYPVRNRKSSVFSFRDAEWRLELRFEFEDSYWVDLRKTTEWGNFEPFHVTTWIEDDPRKSRSIRCQKVNVQYALQNIFVIRECNLLKEIPGFKDDGDFTVVCMFSPAPPYRLKKRPKHQSIEASLEFPPGIEGLSLELGSMLEKGTMPDVQLKCGDGIVPAHRSVLIARSEVFEAMFRNDMEESRSGVVNMPGVDSEVLRLLLKYVYTGKLPETSVDLMCKLFSATNKYAIHGLKKACSDRMRGNLNEENCLDYLVFADTHCDASFKDAVLSFIFENQGTLLRSTDWFRFSKEQPILAVEAYQKCFER